ncbi:MAG: helix-turn-helix domain-containing protein [Sphaerochaeta sp.]|jgi:transcriptional regulator with XRE-family HTH domain|nr:helix-turn-helix domain-containing protein [Sphaerochaeta sp.]MCH3919205.1 helix-turn-helix domain-containing protein [Sphaerochaeta sp.]MCI2045948.1 helix-turn-helix domain-containing protein [Sphaerochaeta sp.]
MRQIDLACIIRQARERAGFTRIALSRAIGLSDSMVSKYEAGYTNPTQENLVKLCSILGLKYPLVCRDGEPEYCSHTHIVKKKKTHYTNFRIS